MLNVWHFNGHFLHFFNNSAQEDFIYCSQQSEGHSGHGPAATNEKLTSMSSRNLKLYMRIQFFRFVFLSFHSSRDSSPWLCVIPSSSSRSCHRHAINLLRIFCIVRQIDICMNSYREENNRKLANFTSWFVRKLNWVELFGWLLATDVWKISENKWTEQSE